MILIQTFLFLFLLLLLLLLDTGAGPVVSGTIGTAGPTGIVYVDAGPITEDPEKAQRVVLRLGVRV
jgi:hypothetical protein